MNQEKEERETGGRGRRETGKEVLGAGREDSTGKGWPGKGGQERRQTEKGEVAKSSEEGRKEDSQRTAWEEEEGVQKALGRIWRKADRKRRAPNWECQLCPGTWGHPFPR